MIFLERVNSISCSLKGVFKTLKEGNTDFFLFYHRFIYGAFKNSTTVMLCHVMARNPLLEFENGSF